MDILIGQLYIQFISGSNGVPPYTYSMENNPGWLSIDQNTGKLWGIPESIESGDVIISITDKNKCTGTYDFSYNVTNGPPVYTCDTSATYYVSTSSFRRCSDCCNQLNLASIGTFIGGHHSWAEYFFDTCLGFTADSFGGTFILNGKTFAYSFSGVFGGSTFKFQLYDIVRIY